MFSFGFFVLSTLFSFAQGSLENPDILWGQKEKTNKITPGDIVGYDDSGIYVRQTKRIGKSPGIILEHYDQKMNKTKSSELILEYQKKEMEFKFIKHIGDKLCMFSSFVNTKQKKRFLFVQSINKKSLQFNKDLKKIAEIDISERDKENIIDGILFGFDRYSSNIGTFRYETSRDDSKFMIYYQLPHKKGLDKKVGFHIFDNQLNQIWEKEVTYHYDEQLFLLTDIKLSNEGNVYLVGREYKEKQKGRKQKANYNYRILNYLNGGGNLKEYTIQVKEKFLINMQVAIDNNQDIICSGFYSETGRPDDAGTYFLKVDEKSKEIKLKKFKKFEPGFAYQRKSKRKEKQAADEINSEFYWYDFHDIILKDDGGAVLIGEQSFVREKTYYEGAKISTTIYYNYNNIIAVNIAPDGDILWVEKIPKRQKSSDDWGLFASYALSAINDKLFLVFNDHKDNLKYNGKGLRENYTGRGIKNTTVILVELDSSGKQSRTPLFSVKDVPFISRPKVSEQVSQNELVLFFKGFGSHRFAKITFE